MEDIVENKLWRFQRGNSGRPKGVQNKATREAKHRIERVLKSMEDTIEEDIKKLKPTDRVRLWLDLQEYIRPKMQRVQVEVDAEQRNITKITFEIKELRNGNQDRGYERIQKELPGHDQDSSDSGQ